MAWNKPNSNTVDATSSSRPAGRGKTPRLRRGLLAGMIVVLGAGIAAWFLTSGEATSSSLHTKERGFIKEVTPVVSVQKPKELTPEEKEQLAHPGMVKSSMGVWQPTNRPWRANSTKVHNVYTNHSAKARGPVPYRNATEQMLYLTFGRPLGSAPMPAVKIPKKDMDNLVAILIDDNKVSDKDSEFMAAGKELITEAKKQMRKFIKDGGTPQEFFDYYQKETVRAYEKRRMARLEILRIAREEKDVDLAKSMRDKVNEELAKEGIMPVKMHLSEDME